VEEEQKELRLQNKKEKLPSHNASLKRMNEDSDGNFDSRYCDSNINLQS
jgi:hypothetical protein